MRAPKRLEVLPLRTMSSMSVCCKLHALFAVHGVADTVVSDNGNAFCSDEFEAIT